MLAILKVRESFNHDEMPRLEGICRRFDANFPTVGCEFFYTLTASEPERFLIIRTATGEREKFVAAVESFGRELNFEVMRGREASDILFRQDLNSFV